MWDPQDANGFRNETLHQRGQISMETEMGRFLSKLASDEQNHRFLEIGTWNGLGSTRCFYEGFQKRKHSLHDPSLQESPVFLDSLEVNSEKCDVARSHYIDAPYIRIHHKSLLDKLPTWSDIEKEYTNEWSEDEKRTYEKYFRTDIENMKLCGTFPLPIPSTLEKESQYTYAYDVALLDGSEFFSYDEFEKIRHIVRIIVLDDCRCLKNKRVYDELVGHSDWKLIQHNMNERNGYAAFQRIG